MICRRRLDHVFCGPAGAVIEEEIGKDDEGYEGADVYAADPEGLAPERGRWYMHVKRNIYGEYTN